MIQASLEQFSKSLALLQFTFPSEHQPSGEWTQIVGYSYLLSTLILLQNASMGSFELTAEGEDFIDT